jgi:hypothetical protein
MRKTKGINIDLGKYTISSDRLQFILNQKGSPASYFVSLEYLLREIVARNLRAADAKTLPELIKAVKENSVYVAKVASQFRDNQDDINRWKREKERGKE